MDKVSISLCEHMIWEDARIFLLFYRWTLRRYGLPLTVLDMTRLQIDIRKDMVLHLVEQGKLNRVSATSHSMSPKGYMWLLEECVYMMSTDNHIHHRRGSYSVYNPPIKRRLNFKTKSDAVQYVRYHSGLVHAHG